MPSVKELREQRAKLAPRLRELADKAHAEKRDFTAEEKKNWEDINTEVNRLGADIERLSDVEKLERELNDPGNDPDPGRDDRNGDPQRKRDRRGDPRGPKAEDRDQALNGWMRRQMGVKVSKRQAEAAERCQIRLNSREIKIRLSNTSELRQHREKRAMSAVALGSGGSFVPSDTFVARLEMAMLAFGGIKQAGAEVIRTDSGDEMTLPSSDDTSNEGEMLVENTAVTDGDVTTAGIRLQAFKCSSKMIKVPVELLEDSAFDLAPMLGGMIGERIARRQNRECTTGTGANRPKGVVTAATLGVTAASATAIADSELIQLVHSVDPAYREDPSVRFMMHDNTLLAVRLLRDGDGNFIWRMGLTDAEPDRLLGYPVTVNQHMASSITNSAKTILFGAFSKVKVREVRTLRLRRLVERYADADQEGFVGFLRFDCNLQDAGTHPLKYLQQLA